MKIVSNKWVTSRSPTPPPPSQLLSCKTNTFLFSPKKCENRVFSLTWPASMQIVWNKRKRLHKKGVQLPQDWFGTPTWPPFHCFGTPIWAPWRHVKTIYWTIHLRNYFTHCARRGRAGLGTKDVLNFESAMIYTKCRSHGSCHFVDAKPFPRPASTPGQLLPLSCTVVISLLVAV